MDVNGFFKGGLQGVEVRHDNEEKPRAGGRVGLEDGLHVKAKR